MRKTLLRLAGVAVTVTALSAVFPAGALPKGVRDTYNQQAPRQYAEGCGEGAEHQLYFDGPSRLWPPNHKYYDGGIAVTAVDTDSSDGDGITLTSTGRHNQYDGDTEWNGSGNTADDIKSDGSDDDGTVAGVSTVDSGNGMVDVTWMVRAERSGHKSDALGEGRVYTITGDAVFDEDGSTCRGSWTITVPHDMSRKNR